MAATAKLKVDEAPKIYDVRRFGVADVRKRGQWIVDRLKDRYAGAKDGELLSWITNAAQSNIFWFMQTDQAVACAQIVREAISPHPKVMELFVLCEPEGEDQAAFLYAEMLTWAKQIGADELRVENFTDVPRDLIKERVGKLLLRDEIYVKIEQVR
jgi:hypothetical protein